MKTFCAWCNKLIKGKGVDLSHGICPRCFQDYFQEQFDFMDGVKRVDPVSSIGSRRGKRCLVAEVAGAWEQPRLFV